MRNNHDPNCGLFTYVLPRKCKGRIFLILTSFQDISQVSERRSSTCCLFVFNISPISIYLIQRFGKLQQTAGVLLS